MPSGKDSVNSRFSHAYVEEEIRNDERTIQILSHFPHARIIPIRNAHEVFDRKHQSYAFQHERQSLILAKREGTLLYKGAPVCQNFNEKYFYYTSLARNCIYDCEYCWLKGMYESGNLVIFLNQEEIMQECENVLQEHELYLCLSYDTDLLALEPFTGMLREWSGFLKKHQNLLAEVRTKCANTGILKTIPVQQNMILAWTMSPQSVIEQYEHLTPSLEDRIQAVKTAMELGFPVRLCFDPMLKTKDWKKEYKAMLKCIAKEIDLSSVRDFSIGSFRISKDYLARMRQNMPDSACAWYPYVLDHGYYHYEDEEEMEGYLQSLLMHYVPEDRIFRWKENP